MRRVAPEQRLPHHTGAGQVLLQLPASHTTTHEARPPHRPRRSTHSAATRASRRRCVSVLCCGCMQPLPALFMRPNHPQQHQLQLLRVHGGGAGGCATRPMFRPGSKTTHIRCCARTWTDFRASWSCWHVPPFTHSCAAHWLLRCAAAPHAHCCAVPPPAFWAQQQPS